MCKLFNFETATFSYNIIDSVGKLCYNMTTKNKKGVNFMSGAISIRPSRDIRTNYAQISELTRKNPVAITVNGKEDTVLMSHEDFIEQQIYVSDLEAKLAVYAHLAQAADDVKLGRVQDVADAFADIKKELADIKL